MKEYGTKEERTEKKRELFNSFNLEADLKEYYGDLPANGKRKFALLLALIHDPLILLLDEPVAGLEREFKDEFWRHLAKIREGRCIIVVTHEIEEAARIADRCVILDEQRVLDNPLNFNDLEKEIAGKVKIIAKSASRLPDSLD